MSEENKQTESYPPRCPSCGDPLPTFGNCSCMNEDTYSYDDPDDCWDGHDEDYPDDDDDCNFFDDELM